MRLDLGSLMKKQAGISLLELVLAIAIVATMIIAATRFYQTTKQNAEAQNSLTMVHEIVDASYKWYESHPNFSTISFTELVKAGLLPTSYNDDKRFNPWGGHITIGAGSSYDKLLLTFTEVPADPCKKLEQQLQQYNAVCKVDSGIITAEF